MWWLTASSIFLNWLLVPQSQSEIENKRFGLEFLPRCKSLLKNLMYCKSFPFCSILLESSTSWCLSNCKRFDSFKSDSFLLRSMAFAFIQRVKLNQRITIFTTYLRIDCCSNLMKVNYCIYFVLLDDKMVAWWSLSALEVVSSEPLRMDRSSD